MIDMDTKVEPFEGIENNLDNININNLKERNLNGLIKEVEVKASGGCSMLCLALGVLIVAGVCFGVLIGYGGDYRLVANIIGSVVLLIGIITFGVLIAGLYSNDINVGLVLTFFGRYVGTVKQSGFLFINPLTSKTRISLKQQNFNGDVIKVNDKYGNPVLMGCVVVWRVTDTAKAIFEVANYSQYVHIQSEGAVREVGCLFPYDRLHDEDVITLKGEQKEVNARLSSFLQERLKPAGIEVIEARITELSYAKEIAEVMLKTQAADAVIAARDKIVNGAVSIVGHALKSLENEGKCLLSREQRVKLVTNMLVVLCGESQSNQSAGASEMRGK